jgi:prevent-host-death family protein
MDNMKIISATEAKQRFAAVIDQAQREPVMIRRQNRDVAVVIAPSDYEKLRGFRVAEFNRLADEAGRQAEANGLTEEILNKILAERD